MTLTPADLAAIRERHVAAHPPDWAGSSDISEHETEACADRQALLAERDELVGRIRDFAATWHIANGHDGNLDACGWSTCLGLLSGSTERGSALLDENPTLSP